MSVVAGVVRLVARHVPGEPHAEAVTPTAVAAVRGTEWMIDARGPGTGVIVVTGEGTVSSARREIKVVLKAGEGTDVAPGNAHAARDMAGRSSGRARRRPPPSPEP